MTKYRALGKHFVPGHWTSMCIPIVVVGIWGEREIRIVSKKRTMLLVSLGSNSQYLMAKGKGNSWLFWWSNYLEEKTHPPSNSYIASSFFLLFSIHQWQAFWSCKFLLARLQYDQLQHTESKSAKNCKIFTNIYFFYKAFST